MTPGNCGIAIRASAPASSGTVALPRCATESAAYAASAASYTFGPGSMIGKYSFSHWYIGAKTSTDSGSVNNLALRRVTTTYSATDGVGKTDEEIVENVSDMQITYLVDWDRQRLSGHDHIRRGRCCHRLDPGDCSAHGADTLQPRAGWAGRGKRRQRSGLHHTAQCDNPRPHAGRASEVTV